MSPDAEDFVVSWLKSVIRSGVERRQGDEWPFALVQRVSGFDIPELGFDDPVIQVDLLHKGSVGSAKTWALDVHEHMIELGLTYPNVTLSDSTVAAPDYLKVLISPHRQPFGDETVVRYVARYKLGLSYVAA